MAPNHDLSRWQADREEALLVEPVKTIILPVLSVRQPWAWAIFRAGKRVENRDWYTSVRGRVAIHAAKGMTKHEYEDAAESIRAISCCKTPDPEDLIRGAILGTVEIIDCVHESDSPWFFGKYGFVLKHPVLFDEPIPARGALGFWEYAIPAELLEPRT